MSAADARAALEDAVERALALLNAWDGDPDQEDGDEDDQCDDEGAIEEDDDREAEASLCGVTFGHGHAVNIGPAGGFTFDMEDQCDDEGHDSDREPSFGGVRMVGLGVDEAGEGCSGETGEGPQ